MRSPILLVAAALLAGCAATPRIVATRTDTVTPVSDVAEALASADVVALGEEHKTPAVHELHLAVIEELHDRRPNMVIAMEMFDRDVQNVLLQYLNGLIDEAEFRAQARPWPEYARDYRPVIEFAKQNGLIVLAANAPAKLVKQASTAGLATVLGGPDVAREVTTADGAAYDAFVESMAGHPGVTEETLRRYWAAQCLRDDTMAETITDYLAKRKQVDDRPLAVLICGRGHSDYRRGVVQRIEQRMPGLDVRVLSVETVDDVDSAVYQAPRDLADYVVVTEEREAAERMPPAAPVKPAAPTQPMPGAGAAKPDAPQPAAAQPEAQPTANPEGQRPALGLMPDYNAGGDGVLVAQVFEGRQAAKAGIEAGDYIVALAGVPTPDVDTYTEVLDAQIIGRTVTVRVRRESAEVDLQVQIGSRSR